MFVAIDNIDMDAFEVEDWINRTREASEGKRISPEFAMEILTKTNFYGHIKKVLKNIREKNKTKEELLAYKDFILSCVNGREMSPQALTMLQEMADACGVRKEFDELNAKPKCYDKDDCDKVVIVKSYGNELYNVDLSMYKKAIFDYVCIGSKYDIVIGETTKLPKICDFSGRKDGKKSHDIRLGYGTDLANVDKFIFNKGDRVEFGVYGFVANLKGGTSVEDYHAENLHGVIDVSMCRWVDFSGCDLKNVEELKTENVEEITLNHVKNFFKKYKFKNNRAVNLDYFNFDEDVKISFENVESVNFYLSKLPEVLDLSGCDEVVFRSCTFDNVKEMKFKEGGKLVISVEVPDDFDFSVFDEVIINGCDLSKIKNLKFKDGAKVYINPSVICDGILDVSNCGEVIFGRKRNSNTELDEQNEVPFIKKIKFKNEEQMEKSSIKRDYRKFVFEEYTPGMGIKKIASLFGGMNK